MVIKVVLETVLSNDTGCVCIVLYGQLALSETYIGLFVFCLVTFCRCSLVVLTNGIKVVVSVVKEER